MQMLEQNDGLMSSRVPFRRNGSFICSHPSLLVDSLSRKSFSYNKLPVQPLTLTIIKLDGTSFVIEVPKSGTVAQLKQGVEAAFSHLPKKGSQTVSWSHVWGHFCLSYRGQKLLADGDHIGSYGIQDDEELHFVRHVSICYNMVREKQRKGPDMEKQIISDGCRDRQENKERDDDDNEKKIENQSDNYESDDSDQGAMSYYQYKLADLFGRWFSYRKLATSDLGMEESDYSPRTSLSSSGSFKNGVWLSSDKYNPRRESWKVK